MEQTDRLWSDFPTTGSTTDSRQMCFRQGKAFVHMPAHDRSRVVTEWPNGVVDHYLIADKTIMRTWPDGHTQHFAPGDPAGKKYPQHPSAAA